MWLKIDAVSKFKKADADILNLSFDTPEGCPSRYTKLYIL